MNMFKKLFLFLIAAFIFGAALKAQTWKPAGNAEFAPTLLYGFAKLSLGADGTLWAAVNNKSTASNLEVYKLAKDSATWVKVGRGVMYDNAYNGSIVVDANNTPWLASKGSIFCLQGKKWTQTFIGTYWKDGDRHFAKAYELGNFCTLAADSKGGVYATSDYYGGLYAKDDKLAANNWDATVYDASRMVSFFPIGADKSEYGIGYKVANNYAGNPVVKVVNDVIYFAYDEYYLTQHWGFHVSKWNGNGWTDLGDFGSKENATGGFSEGAAELLDIAISKSGKVFVVYREGSGADASRQWKASAMMFNGTDDWAQMGKRGFSAGTTEAFPFSAAFDSKETPYACYADEENGTVNVMKFVGGAWVKVGGGVSNGASPHMIMGPDDTIYVAYREKGGTGSITVKKLKL
jgi:hypothetical protein